MTDQNTHEPSPMDAIQDQPCGHVLTAARTKKNISLEAVANHLKLSVAQVTALEQDDYPNQQLSTFHKGYLKRYCRWLDLSAEQLFMNLEAHGFHTAQPKVYYQSDSVKAHQNRLQAKPSYYQSSRTSRSKYATISILGGLGLAFVVLTQWLMHAGNIKTTQKAHVLHAALDPKPVVSDRPKSLDDLLQHTWHKPENKTPPKKAIKVVHNNTDTPDKDDEDD